MWKALDKHRLLTSVQARCCVPRRGKEKKKEDRFSREDLNGVLWNAERWTFQTFEMPLSGFPFLGENASRTWRDESTPSRYIVSTVIYIDWKLWCYLYVYIYNIPIQKLFGVRTNSYISADWNYSVCKSCICRTDYYTRV